MTSTHKNRLNRRSLLKGAAASTVGILAAPMVARAESKSIKIGMTTILSGRVAQLGTSSRNAVMMEVEKINAAGGLAGRQIEMVIRDSKGQPQEAARIAALNAKPIADGAILFRTGDKLYILDARPGDTPQMMRGEWPPQTVDDFNQIFTTRMR